MEIASSDLSDYMRNIHRQIMKVERQMESKHARSLDLIGGDVFLSRGSATDERPPGGK